MASEALVKYNQAAGNRRLWTVSQWIKRSEKLDTRQAIFSSVGDTSNDNTVLQWGFLGDGKFQIGVNSVYILTSAEEFRDNTEWYHVVVQLNTAQAGVDDRLKIWINNRLLANWDTDNRSTKLTQNIELGIGQVGSHYVGCITGGYDHFHGQIHDTYYVNGQALQPSDFGRTNADSKWVTKHPGTVKASINSSGGFGPDGAYLPMTENHDRAWNVLNATDAAGKSYSFAGVSHMNMSGFSKGKKCSLMFPATSNNPTLQIANNSDFDFGTGDYTFEGWLAWFNWGGNQRIFLYGQSGTSILELGRGSSNNNLYAYHNTSSQHIAYNFNPTLRRWYHIGYVRQSGTTRLYIDGTQVQADSSSSSSQSLPNNGTNMEIGGLNWANGYHHQGWIDSVRIVKGQCLYPDGTAFTPANVLSPTTYSTDGGSTTSNITGTVGACFSPDFKVAGTAEEGDGWDANQNSNGASRFGDDREATDSSAKNNFCKMNLLDEMSDPSATQIDNYVYSSNANKHIRGTHKLRSGKWYWEFKTLATAPDAHHGVSAAYTLDRLRVGGMSYLGEIGTNWSYYILASNPQLRNNGVSTSSTTGGGAQYDTFMVAMDCDSGKLWFGKNGTWHNSGDPGAGTNASYTNLRTSGGGAGVKWGWMVHAMPYDATGGEWYNFGQGLDSYYQYTTNVGTGQSHADDNGIGRFEYDPPTGFLAICDRNMPEPTIKDGTAHFQPHLFLGTGSLPNAQTIATGFKPGLVILKNDAYHWRVFDAVRPTAALYWNRTEAEDSYNDHPEMTMDANGFSLISNPDGPDNVMNAVNSAHYTWCWKGGDNNVTNTDGTITSTVSANPTGGFSAVKYTGNGVSGATVGHGLNGAPDVVMVKGAGGGTMANWNVSASGLWTGYLQPNSDSALNTTAGRWPTLGNADTVSLTTNYSHYNESGTNYIMYCFQMIEGFSEFGEYYGNGSTDGPYIPLGFKPSALLVKRMDSASTWNFYQMGPGSDNEYNSVNSHFHPNLSQARATASPNPWFDAVAGGIKIRNTYNEMNLNNGRYFYMAWGEKAYGYQTAE